MAKWSEIAQSETFQSSSTAERLAAKKQFFDTKVVTSEAYSSLPEAKQSEWRRRFAVLDPMEADNRNTMTKVVDAGKKFVDWNANRDPLSKPLAAVMKIGDKVVDTVADAVVGNPKASPEGAKLTAQDSFGVGRGIAGEFIRGYKPTDVATFVGAAKVIKPVLGPVAKAIGKVIPDNIKSAFKVGHNAPKEYLAAADEADLARQAGAREAEEVGNKLFYAQEPMEYTSAGKVIKLKKGDRLPEEMQQHIGRIFRGEFDASLRPRPFEFKDNFGSRTNITIQGNTAEIAGIYAKGKGTHLYQRVIESLKDKGVKTIDVTLQSGDSQAALKSLVNKGILTNPRNFDQAVKNGPARTFDIVGNKPSLQDHPQFAEMNKIAAEGRQVMDKWSKSLLASGIPQGEVEQTIKDNIGTYMARMFRSKLKSNSANPYTLQGLSLRIEGLMKRKDLSEDVLKKLGEIKEPALPTAIRVKQISESVANESLFKKVAANKEWSADTNVTGTMKQIPNSPKFGSLRNKWVIPEIAGDINAIKGIGSDVLNNIPIYSKFMSSWKFGKVVLNPATHARNTLTNTILLDLSGVNHIRQAELFPKVVEDYIKKGPIYQKAVEHGAIGNEFIGGDIKAIKDWYMAGSGSNTQRWLNVLKTPFDKAGDLYRAEEQIAKLIKFQHGVEAGIHPKLAAKDAQKWLFDYNKIPDAVKVTKLAAPFFTFTYKAVPRVAEALMDNPLRVYKYKALFDAVNTTSQKTMGMTPEQYAKEKKSLPPWVLQGLGGMPTNLMLPYKDKDGRSQWLNLEYLLPLGQAPDIFEQGVLKGGISNPVYNLISDLDKNTDFKGQAIVPVGATKKEAAMKTIQYIYKTLAPSFAPAIGELEGGYSWEKVSKAIQGVPDYAGRLRDLGPVMLDVLAGIKITPVDVKEANQFKMADYQKQYQDLRKQAIKIMSPAYNPKLRDRDLNSIYKKVQKISDDIKKENE